MTSYTRFVPPLAPIRGAPGDFALSALMLDRLRNNQTGRRKVALDDRENEGGSMAASDVAAPAPLYINKDTGALGSRRGKVVMGRWKP